MLRKDLAKGPLSHGYRTSLWTTARIAEVIRTRFAVRYHRDHIGRLMRTLGGATKNPSDEAPSATRPASSA
jgi:putative transposase